MPVLLLFALIALAACGRESLTYDESMDLLASAMERTIANEYTVEVNDVYVVEAGNSSREYTYYNSEIHYKSDLNSFGYIESRSPFSPLDVRRFITLDGENYVLVAADKCYSHSGRTTVSVSGGQVTTTTTSEVQETADSDVLVTTSFSATTEGFGSYQRELYRDYDYSGEKWVEEDGSSVAMIEFKPDPDFRFSFKIRDGYLVESNTHSEGDNHGRLVWAGFDGKIVADKTVTRFYDIGVEKEFPVPEPTCE